MKGVPSNTHNASSDFFRKVSNTVPAMVAVYNIKTGEYIYVNDSIKKLLGYSPQDFITKGFPFVVSLVHPDDLEDITKKNAEALMKANSKKSAKTFDNSIVAFEYRMRHKNGSWVWLKTDGSVFGRDENGMVSMVMNISIDITERKMAEEELRALSLQLKTDFDKRTKDLNHILENISDGFAAYDKDMRYMYVNKKAASMLTKLPEEIIGKRVVDVFPQFAKSPVYIKMIEVLQSGEQQRMEYYSERFNSWMQVNFYPSPDGISIFYTDITQRKNLEKQKDEFLAMASHELKTPVTSIKAYAQVLQSQFQKRGDIKSAGLLGKMDAQIDKLTGLISDLLDVTKIEAGKLGFNNEVFEVNNLVKEVAEEMQRTTERHIISVKLGKRSNVLGDRERTGQVLTNFLSNAIKYSPQSKKIIVITNVNDTSVEVSVRDFGIGIKARSIDKVFERFYRVSGEKENTYPGLGLGLFISSEIITRQHGKIWVTSNPGEGSTFYFSLPLYKKGTP